MNVLAENVKSGKPYLGTSAGSNIPWTQYENYQ